LEIIVLERVFKIKCPHCGKEIYVTVREKPEMPIPKVKVPKPSEVPKIPLPEVKIETPMEAKKMLYEWIARLPVGATFTIDDIKKALKVSGYEGSIRGFGNILYHLSRKGYLEIVSLKKLPDGREHNIYKVVKKLEV